MSKVTIELPAQLVEFAEAQVAAGRYTDVADYIRSMIRDRKQASDRLVAEIQKGLDSGDSDRSFGDIWQAGMERGRSRAA
jgi:putative addiction module CopG family antidote